MTRNIEKAESIGTIRAGNTWQREKINAIQVHYRKNIKRKEKLVKDLVFFRSWLPKIKLNHAKKNQDYTSKLFAKMQLCGEFQAFQDFLNSIHFELNRRYKDVKKMQGLEEIYQIYQFNPDANTTKEYKCLGKELRQKIILDRREAEVNARIDCAKKNDPLLAEATLWKERIRHKFHILFSQQKEAPVPDAPAPAIRLTHAKTHNPNLTIDKFIQEISNSDALLSPS